MTVNNSASNSTVKTSTITNELNPDKTKAVGGKPNYKTLPLAPNVITKFLAFGTNNLEIYLTTNRGSELPTVDLINDNDSAENAQARGGTSSFRSEYEKAVQSQQDSNLSGITENIFRENVITSEEDNPKAPNIQTPVEKLPHSPHTVFLLRKEGQVITPKKDNNMDIDENKDKNDTPFTNPRRFSSNFHRFIRENTKKSLTLTKNKFEPLTDNSDSDLDDEIGKRVKKRKKKPSRKKGVI